ncbi:MAG: cell division protein FtsZ, partial [Snodgrassella sp.]|nr:cell division protein FtsZ [Snodgrassella sp.]
MGILTVAVVTRPFEYEGKRIQVANNGIEILKNTVDSLIVIPNDKLMSALGEDVSMREAFRAADNVLRNAVAGIAEVITNPGIINLDFADVKNVMSIMGMAMMGSGSAHGVDRARIATEQAIASPLLDDVTLDGAQGVLVNITTAPGCLKMSEYKEVMCMIDEYAHDDAALKYGTSEDPSMEEGEIRVTIIATGLQEQKVLHHQQSSNLRVLQTVQSTGTDDVYPDIGSVVRSGRSARSMNLAAADFSNQSVLDDFEIPAVIRRQAD